MGAGRQILATLAKQQPILANIGPFCSEFSQHRRDLGSIDQAWPNSVEFGVRRPEGTQQDPREHFSGFLRASLEHFVQVPSSALSGGGGPTGGESSGEHSSRSFFPAPAVRRGSSCSACAVHLSEGRDSGGCCGVAATKLNQDKKVTKESTVAKWIEVCRLVTRTLSPSAGGKPENKGVFACARPEGGSERQGSIGRARLGIAADEVARRKAKQGSPARRLTPIRMERLAR